MAVITATEARKNIYQLINKLSREHEPILIKGKQSNAVLVSEEDWRAIQETLYLTSIPGMTRDLKEGVETPVTEMSTKLDW